MAANPNITLWFLNASRAARVAWCLEELDLPYRLEFSERSPAGLAPPEWRAKIPGPLKKSPTMTDGDFVLQESGAIIQYLCAKYDPSNRLMPSDPARRGQVLEWLHSAEGFFMMYGIGIMYARSRLPEAHKNLWPEMNKLMSPNMHNALNWLDNTMKAQHEKGSKYLVGDSLTAADLSMLFSIQLIYNRKLGLEGTDLRWQHIEKWQADMEATESWRKTVQKTGFRVYGML